MGFSTFLSKFVLGTIFSLLWAASFCLLGIGAYSLHTTISIGHLSDETRTTLPSIILLACGVFLFLLGVLGCFACKTENRCLLSGFFIILLLVLLAEMSAGLLAFAYRGNFEGEVSKELKRQLNFYNNDTQLRDSLDSLQSNLHCCGVENYTDWLSTDWSKQHNGTVPQSCCQDKKCTDGLSPSTDGRVFDEACLPAFEAKFSGVFSAIIDGALGLAILQTLGLLASCILICHSRRSPRPYEIFGNSNGGRYV